MNLNRRKKILLLTVIFLVGSFCFFQILAGLVLAQEGPATNPCDPSLGPLSPACNDQNQQFLGNPLAGPEDPDYPAFGYAHKPVGIPGLIGRVLQGIIGIVGTLVFGVVIYGGFLWLFSSGNEEKITKAKGLIMWAILGLLVVFGAYAITSYTLTTITNVATQPGAEGEPPE